ncbi:dethiobiotin synthase [Shewanella intestini]|uniref:ATP-dependent dethiobiotin synthetase BioD n=1 Tax=Shewanella intestini TaxID=2017544 RepID=A0ABS5HYY7_9GAMM|nr:dethiobiotin synthase [Shewanella sp. XMDDZSB0408]MBR9727003.1 dethiobiotin synthase [Shewanella intestini]
MFFVTGTDTDSGKTLISSALLSSAKGKTCGFKPIASGCEATPEGLRNSDALALMAQANMVLDYQQVNPISFAPAIAPHIAAMQIGQTLSAQQVTSHLISQPLLQADFALIEGAGGWLLPLGEQQYLSHSVIALNRHVQQTQQLDVGVGVIIVVGMKLGCLNHALLTQLAIENDGLHIAGWVANQVDGNMSEIEANLASLQQMMHAPFLGYVPHLSCPSAENAASYLDIAALN